ncbi:MAG: tyrosine-type recombinase/integrase [Propionibacteriaceae bacterium]|nr:tyrosine-type recombinase/integrase [Propionibacteriaceae bacterium]
MNPITALIGEYVAFRRAAGVGLVRAEKLLRQFAAWLDGRPSDGPKLFTARQALAWAGLPAGATSWQGLRLGVVRAFARWLHARDLPVDVPSLKQLPTAGRRAVPYIYKDSDVVGLMGRCDRVFSVFRAATMRALVGLLAVTGMRVGEAIGLDVGDVDLDDGSIRIRRAKLGRERLVFLTPTSCRAVADYLTLPIRPAGEDAALFVSLAGTRLLYCNVQEGFARLVRGAGLASQPGARPRLHDLRYPNLGGIQTF